MILGEEICLLWGQEYITDRIGDISYQISPLSFYQVNPIADPEALRKGTGIRRPSRSGNSMGSLLWNRNHFPVPGTESKICPWCGNCSGSY